MNCSKARQVLEGFSSGSAREEREAQQHLFQCPGCQQYLHQNSLLRRRLGEMEREKPSLEFKERLFTEISRRRWEGFLRLWRRRAALASSVAILVLLVALGWSWFRPLRPPDLVEFLVEDHQRNLPGDVMLASSSPSEIERWFAGRVDFPLNVAQPAGMEIVGARLCRIEKKRAALLFYRREGHPVSWFLFPAAGTNPSTARTLRRVRGYGVVLWSRAGVSQAVVSDLDPERLLAWLSPSPAIGR